MIIIHHSPNKQVTYGQNNDSSSSCWFCPNYKNANFIQCTAKNCVQSIFFLITKCSKFPLTLSLSLSLPFPFSFHFARTKVKALRWRKLLWTIYRNMEIVGGPRLICDQQSTGVSSKDIVEQKMKKKMTLKHHSLHTVESFSTRGKSHGKVGNRSRRLLISRQRRYTEPSGWHVSKF